MATAVHVMMSPRDLDCTYLESELLDVYGVCVCVRALRYQVPLELQAVAYSSTWVLGSELESSEPLSPT